MIIQGQQWDRSKKAWPVSVPRFLQDIDIKVIIWEDEQCVEIQTNISCSSIRGANITHPDIVMLVILDTI